MTEALEMKRHGEIWRQAGWVSVTADHEITKHYECAAWYRTVAVSSGERVPLWRTPSGWFIAIFNGIVTGSNFTSRIGAHYGPAQIDEDKGQRAEASIQLDAFSVGRIIGGRVDMEYEIELLPGWRNYEIGAHGDGTPMCRVMTEQEADNWFAARS